MYSNPSIVASNRSYIKVYIDGVRHRFYNGRRLGIACNPNRQKTPQEKARALNTLVYTLKKKLEAGWSPGIKPAKPAVKIPPAGQCIKDAVADVQEEDLSLLYTRDLAKVGKSFLEFLNNEGLDHIPITDLKPQYIKCFLKPYKKSSSYYMLAPSVGVFGMLGRIPLLDIEQ